jgi:ribosome-associated protein
MEQFELDGNSYIELNNLLKTMGLCSSGGFAKQEIMNGKVTVDGVVETRKRCKIRGDQVVEYNGIQVRVIEKG